MALDSVLSPKVLYVGTCVREVLTHRRTSLAMVLKYLSGLVGRVTSDERTSLTIVELISPSRCFLLAGPASTRILLMTERERKPLCIFY